MRSSSHQAKRPYAGTHSAAQQSITSYFSAILPCASTNPSPLSQCTIVPQTPPLADSIQSNLLSVGMRVRKSVPEGYKTGQQYSAFGLFSDAKPAVSVEPAAPTARKMTSYQRAELTPFCGIMKVGGFGVQSFGQEDEVPDEDDVPFFSSQGSTVTNASVDDDELARGKRRFDEEDNEEDDVDIVDSRAFGIWRDVSSRVASIRSDDGWQTQGRPLAVPKRRLRGISRQKLGVGQENSGFAVDMDFEEADFLDFNAWKDDEMEL